MVAMFTKGGEKETTYTDNQTESVESATVIGQSVFVEGTLKSEEHIRIEGHVKGSITTTKNITVGKNANIEANVEAENMHISGEVHGNLHATGTIELLATARVYGDISTHIISIETGAILQGQCTTGNQKEASALEKKESVASEKTTN